MTGKVVLSVLAALLVSGCGAGSSDAPAAQNTHAGHTPDPTAGGRPAQAMAIEQLATTVGCQAKITLAVADYRQATCEADGTRLVILDFISEDGMRAWVDHAKWYGGNYLVGERWALSGNDKQYLETLQTTLGGTVEQGEAH